MRQVHRIQNVALGVLTLSLLLLTPPLRAVGDSAQPQPGSVVILLKNGDQLTGIVVAENASRLILKSPLLGRTRIPLQDIASRRAPTPPPVAQVAVPPPQKPPTAAGPQPAPTPAGRTNAPPPAAASKPTTPPPPPPPKPRPWHVDLQFGSSMQYNQQDVEIYYGKAGFNYSQDKLRITAEYKRNFGTFNKVLSVDNMDGLFRTEYDLTKSVFAFNAAGAGYDLIRLIELRYDDSLGLGYKLVTRPNLRINGDIGANIQHLDFTRDPPHSYISFRIGESVFWKITEKLTLDQKIEFMPRSLGLQNFQVRGEATLSFSITSLLNLNFTMADTYDDRPAAGISPNDLQFRSSIGFRY